MSNLPSIGVWSLSVLLLAAPVLAQQSPSDNPPTATEQKPAIPAPTTTAPEPPTATVEPPPATVGGPASTGDAHLVVATVKLKDGLRASKLIGSAVFNDQNEKIGSIDDLILTRDNKVAMRARLLPGLDSAAPGCCRFDNANDAKAAFGRSFAWGKGHPTSRVSPFCELASSLAASYCPARATD